MMTRFFSIAIIVGNGNLSDGAKTIYALLVASDSSLDTYQLMERLGRSRNSICRWVAELKKINAISETKNGSRPCVYKAVIMS